MDAESLKIILDLQHKVSMYERMFMDVLISLSPNQKEPMPEYNYHVDSVNQATIGLVIKRINELKRQKTRTKRAKQC